jgi:hypothetical protein
MIALIHQSGTVLPFATRPGMSSALMANIRAYREAAESFRVKTAVFEVAFKRLPKRARVNEVLEREIIEMQEASKAKLSARDALIEFIDHTF